MNIAIDIPEEVGRVLQAGWGDLSRRTLEAVAAEAYRENVLTAAEVGRLLDHSSRWETESFLREAEVHLDYTEADLERDLATLRQARD
jgi:predicted HTH domain antitoxin